MRYETQIVKSGRVVALPPELQALVIARLGKLRVKSRGKNHSPTVQVAAAILHAVHGVPSVRRAEVLAPAVHKVIHAAVNAIEAPAKPEASTRRRAKGQGGTA